MTAATSNTALRSLILGKLGGFFRLREVNRPICETLNKADTTVLWWLLPVLHMAVRHGHCICDLKRRLDAFGTKYAPAVSKGTAGVILSQTRDYFLNLNRELLLSSHVYEHQRWLYGHVARLPPIDTACWVVFVRDEPV